MAMTSTCLPRLHSSSSVDCITIASSHTTHKQLGGRMKKSFNIEMDSVKMSPDMTLEDVAKMIYKLQVGPYVCMYICECM